jgi:UPF0716 family protein affecting phage T7 exclusion
MVGDHHMGGAAICLAVLGASAVLGFALLRVMGQRR